jgi:hypothetical protein
MYSFNPGTWRTLVEKPDECFNLVLWGLSKAFDAAVGVVAHPARHSELSCFIPRERAEVDALHLSPHNGPNRSHRQSPCFESLFNPCGPCKGKCTSCSSLDFLAAIN